MASGPITSLQIDGETMETVRDFIFWGSRITADGDCSHEKTLVPWKKSYDQSREHIKSRDITLPIKVHLVKAMVYPVVTQNHFPSQFLAHTLGFPCKDLKSQGHCQGVGLLCQIFLPGKPQVQGAVHLCGSSSRLQGAPSCLFQLNWPRRHRRRTRSISPTW